MVTTYVQIKLKKSICWVAQKKTSLDFQADESFSETQDREETILTTSLKKGA